jgi:hypothetical protein
MAEEYAYDGRGNCGNMREDVQGKARYSVIDVSPLPAAKREARGASIEASF